MDITWKDVNVPWLYTAYSRATNMDNIYIYKGLHPSIILAARDKHEAIKPLIDMSPEQRIAFIKKKIQVMIMRHRNDDDEAIRYGKRRSYLPSEYITGDYIYQLGEACNWCCCMCGQPTELDTCNAGMRQMSIDRKDNKLAHIVNNCQIMCWHCNCTKH